MARTFQDFCSENLSQFGMSIAPSDIPDYETVLAVMTKILRWTETVDELTWGIIRGADLSDGLWYAGFFEGWEGLYQLYKGNTAGTYADTQNNIVTCIQHAKHQADDEPTGLAGGTGIEDVIGESQ
ncbi:MAG: hypothetical protein ABIQ73_13835 [Acidimicrobiales bacterium]